MDSGLYIAASGMLAEMVRQEQISNELANAATPGYKTDHSNQAAFGELLLHNTKTGAAVGRLGLGVEIADTSTDLTPAPIHQTGEPLDFAIEGEGFFAVLTRDGQFTEDAEGVLTDALGNPVIGSAGGPVRVGADGTVPASAVGVFAVTGAEKIGDSLYTGTAAGDASGAAKAGALEESAVDPAKSMVQMISSFRSLEADQKSIQTIDETLNESGQIGGLS